jgi:hypothetical protein
VASDPCPPALKKAIVQAHKSCDAKWIPKQVKDQTASLGAAVQALDGYKGCMGKAAATLKEKWGGTYIVCVDYLNRPH